MEKTTKEVLHTLGASTTDNKEVLITLPANQEWHTSISDFAVIVYKGSEYICDLPYSDAGKSKAELICKAVNERQKLLDSNRELLEALTEMHNMVQGANIEKTERMYNAITMAQIAIKNGGLADR